jgi:hypothetical protein
MARNLNNFYVHEFGFWTISGLHLGSCKHVLKKLSMHSQTMDWTYKEEPLYTRNKRTMQGE